MKRLIKACACAAIFVIRVTDAAVQDTEALRTNPWGAYARGGVVGREIGLSECEPRRGDVGRTGIRTGHRIQPAAWVRFGLNREISKCRRKQRFAEFQPVGPLFGSSDAGFTELGGSYGGRVYGRISASERNSVGLSKREHFARSALPICFSDSIPFAGFAAGCRGNQGTGS